MTLTMGLKAPLLCYHARANVVLFLRILFLAFLIFQDHLGNDIGGSRGHRRHPILLFLYTFLPKSAHIRDWHPTNMSAPPAQWEILDLPLKNIYPLPLHSLEILQSSLKSCIFTPFPIVKY